MFSWRGLSNIVLEDIRLNVNVITAAESRGGSDMPAWILVSPGSAGCRFSRPCTIRKRAERTGGLVNVDGAARTSVAVKTSTSQCVILILRCVSEWHLSGKISNHKKNPKDAKTFALK